MPEKRGVIQSARLKKTLLLLASDLTTDGAKRRSDESIREATGMTKDRCLNDLHHLKEKEVLDVTILPEGGVSVQHFNKAIREKCKEFHRSYPSPSGEMFCGAKYECPYGGSCWVENATHLCLYETRPWHYKLTD